MTDKTFMVYYPRASVPAAVPPISRLWPRPRQEHPEAPRACRSIRQMMPLLVLPVVVGASLAFLNLAAVDTGRSMGGGLHRLRRLDGGRPAQSVRPAGRVSRPWSCISPGRRASGCSSSTSANARRRVMTHADAKRRPADRYLRLHLSQARARTRRCSRSAPSTCRPMPTMRIIVADNDVVPSARDAGRCAGGASFRSKSLYVHCPASNISIARNACLDNSTGDFLAFIDDDETASQRLAGRTAGDGRGDRRRRRARAGAAPSIPTTAPGWMRRGDFHSTLPVWVGGEIRTGYTCNVMLRRASPHVAGRRFNLALGQTGGEDTEYFTQMHEAGGRIAYAPRGAGLRAGARQTARASRGWPSAGSGSARPMAGCSATGARASGLFRRSGLPRPRRSIASRRPRRSSSFRSAATATRCAASCMPASSADCSACAKSASTATPAGEAQRCSLT